MPARAAALALGLRAFVLVGAEGDATASWLSPSAELGDAAPAAPDAAGTLVSAIVFSRAAYQIGLLRGAREGGPPRAGDADDLRVRTPAGAFVPLPPGVPVTVASGTGTAGAGAVVAIELRASATYDAPPGARRERLRLLVNGQPVDAELAVRWSVPAAASVAPDPRPYDLRSVEPGAPGRYAMEPRAYLVTSNVPWRLEALLREAPRQRGTPEGLGAESVEVVTEREGRKALRPGAPVVVATGAATGRSGRPVEVKLFVRSDGDEAAGLYQGELEMRVRPQAEASAPAGSR
jgi:hypothetical protein